jgi:hypothetical protein
MANLVAYCQINFIPAAGAGTPATPSAAGFFQIVTPWGATAQCLVWEEAVNQAFFRVSKNSGRMGSYFLSGTTNGLATTVSGTMTASDINSTP